MRVIVTFIWAFLLAHMITYIVGSIKQAPYDFTFANILAVGFTVLIALISAVFPKDEEMGA